MKSSHALHAIGFAALLFACSQPARHSTLKETWNYSNNPERLGQYSFRYDELPSSGQHASVVWSGDYWPSYKGGIAQRWLLDSNILENAAYPILKNGEWTTAELKALSPAEKYDLYTGDYSFALTRSERQRTGALYAIEGSESYFPGYSIPEWEGLCHGWAPATLDYLEPKAISVSNPDGLWIPFASADIKALLSLLMHEAEGTTSQILGRRCEADFGQLQLDLSAGRIDKKTYDSIVESSACRDTNAGSFHVVLANELGKYHHGFLADIRRDQEVWNQGLYDYVSSAGPIETKKSEGAAPETVFELDVTTTVHYIREVPSTWDAEAMQDGGILGQASYRYRLELNQDHEIVGGAWLSEERPDFLWTMTRARSSKLMNKLPELYKLATGDELFPQ
ncbi:MAG: hypothetical protein NTX25_19485 [Proteobacteria bacterium]|nr:hypothetical protein [Pseudomonadota bacterium]